MPVSIVPDRPSLPVAATVLSCPRSCGLSADMKRTTAAIVSSFGAAVSSTVSPFGAFSTVPRSTASAS